MAPSLGEGAILSGFRWSEKRHARQHYDERAIAALILSIALIDVWNRLNLATWQVAGEWVKSAARQGW